MLGSHHLIGAKANRPVLGAVQDAVIGAWKMTAPETRIRRRASSTPGVVARTSPIGTLIGLHRWR